MTNFKKRLRILVWVLLGVLAILVTWLNVQRALKRAPAPDLSPLEGRTELVQKLAPETLMESIDNLPNFDDTVWVMGGIGVANISNQDGYEYSRLYIPRLNRVRKILAGLEGHREEVVAKVEKLLSDACTNYEAAYEETQRKLSQAKGPLIVEAPEEIDKKEIFARAGVYMLAEARSYESLPLMSQIYARPERLPVSRLFVFYSMHVLATSFPRENLAPEAVRALEAYLSKTAHLPKPAGVSVPAWNAKFEESEFRPVMGVDLGLKNEPQITLTVYPRLFGYEGPYGDIKPEIEDHVKALREFIKLLPPREPVAKKAGTTAGKVPEAREERR